MAKPRSVTWALGLFWLTIVLGTLRLLRTLWLPVGSVDHSFTIFMFVCIYSVMALVTLYIGMRAAWARGLMAVLFVVAIFPAAPLALNYFSVMPLIASLSLIQAVALFAGLYLVYREPAASWFKAPRLQG